MQSRCLVFFCRLVGFAGTPLPTGLCMKAFLSQFDFFSATWVPIYFPVLTRASGDFFAFSGIIQYAPAFCAPIMRPSPQRAITRRLERCRRSAASIAEMYFMPYIVYISSLTILYSQLGIMSRGSNCFTFYMQIFAVFKSQGAAKAAALHRMCVCIRFLFLLFLLCGNICTDNSTAADEQQCDPQHEVACVTGLGRLRIVRQFYRYGVGFFDFLGAVFVTVILIAAVAVTILQQP